MDNSRNDNSLSLNDENVDNSINNDIEHSPDSQMGDNLAEEEQIREPQNPLKLEIIKNTYSES